MCAATMGPDAGATLAFGAPAALRGACPTHKPRLCARDRRPTRAAADPPSTPRLPSDYAALREQAVSSVRTALADGVTLCEVQFPPVANMATAALNQIQDANRAFARDFITPFIAELGVGAVEVVMPDAAEARLAKKLWGDETAFGIRAIPKPGSDSFVRSQASKSPDDPKKLVVCVNPGFNVSEWIDMESLEGLDPVILINGDLDKVRGGYYPRIFYPGLHAVKDRFLSRFEPVYYVKQFSNGGTLFRAYPSQWLLFYTPVEAGTSKLVRSFESRPEFRLVEDLLRNERTADRLAR